MITGEIDYPGTTPKAEYTCNDTAQFPASNLTAAVSLDSFAAAQILGAKLSPYLRSSFDHKLFRAWLGAFYTKANMSINLQ